MILHALVYEVINEHSMSVMPLTQFNLVSKSLQVLFSVLPTILLPAFVQQGLGSLWCMLWQVSCPASHRVSCVFLLNFILFLLGAYLITHNLFRPIRVYYGKGVFWFALYAQHCAIFFLFLCSVMRRCWMRRQVVFITP